MGVKTSKLFIALSMQIMANDLPTYASFKSFGSFMDAIFIRIHTSNFIICIVPYEINHVLDMKEKGASLLMIIT